MRAHLSPRRTLRSLLRAQEGATLTEFGLIAPVMLMMLMGAFDIGHTMYMQAVLQGAVQKAARDSTLQSAAGNVATARNIIDDAVEGQLLPLNRNAEITITRRFYRTFTDAAAAQKEETTDSNNNKICDNGESYVDANNNGTWDADGGDSVDRAGARDNIVYTVKVEYPRLFPLNAFIGLSDTTHLEARTVLSNQPYGDQSEYDAPTTRQCT
jgi:Flp pilus assembly protein TadG